MTLKKLDTAELINKKISFSMENPQTYVEIFKSPHLYNTDEEVIHKLEAIKNAFDGWIILDAGYIDEGKGKRAVVLHYKP